jgi:hypothetical protein
MVVAIDLASFGFFAEWRYALDNRVLAAPDYAAKYVAAIWTNTSSGSCRCGISRTIAGFLADDVAALFDAQCIRIWPAID